MKTFSDYLQEALPNDLDLSKLDGWYKQLQSSKMRLWKTIEDTAQGEFSTILDNSTRNTVERFQASLKSFSGALSAAVEAFDKAVVADANLQFLEKHPQIDGAPELLQRAKTSYMLNMKPITKFLNQQFA